MKPDKKELCTAVFVSVLVLSNILSAKLVAIGSLIVPGGVVCYAVTYLISDVIGERYGRECAEKTVLYGLICQIICTAMLVLTLALPGAGDAEGAAFNAVCRSGVWLTAASLAAYILSQIIDVALFHGIRERMISKGKPYKWLWNNVSTLVSQVADTVVFVGIAYGLGQRFPLDFLVHMAVCQIIVKSILAAADTPLFYLLTKKRRGK